MAREAQAPGPVSLKRHEVRPAEIQHELEPPFGDRQPANKRERLPGFALRLYLIDAPRDAVQNGSPDQWEKGGFNHAGSIAGASPILQIWLQLLGVARQQDKRASRGPHASAQAPALLSPFLDEPSEALRCLTSE